MSEVIHTDSNELELETDVGAGEQHDVERAERAALYASMVIRTYPSGHQSFVSNNMIGVEQ